MTRPATVVRWSPAYHELMTDPTDREALRAYLAAGGRGAADLVTALDAVVRAAHPGFDVAVKYGMLMYTLGRDWRHWVCAIGTTNTGVALRFLYGVVLDDPRGVLRPGSSVLMTWDFAPDTVVDAAAIGAYVRQAVSRHPEYLAQADTILQAARASAPGRMAAHRAARKPK